MVEKAMESDRNQPSAEYQHVKNVKKTDLQRFHGYQPRQKSKRYDMWSYNNRKGHYVPCMHAGPCSKKTCSCIQTKNACMSYCIMGPLSSNFFSGCRCAQGCQSNEEGGCPCLISGRECDPELCKCGICADQTWVPRSGKTRHCYNDNVRMRRDMRGLYVDQSTIPGAGMGLFCDTATEKGTYIGEVRSLWRIVYCRSLDFCSL